MTVSLATADVRARFMRELHRLHARPFQGGPMTAVRLDYLLAFDDSDERTYVVTEETLARLASLPDAVGADSVWEALLR